MYDIDLFHFLIGSLRISPNISLGIVNLLSVNWCGNFILSDFRISLNLFYSVVSIAAL